MGRESQTVTESAGGGTGRMASEQHLYSDAIYRINSVVESIIDEHSEFFSNFDIQLWPTQLDSFLGEFRWLLLRKEDWRFNEIFLKAIAALEDNFRNSWREEKKGKWKLLANTWPEVVDRTDPCFGEIDGKLLPDLWDEVIDKPCNYEGGKGKKTTHHHHRAFMKLVEGRSFPKREYHDGIVLEEITKGGEESEPILLDRIHTTRSGEERDKDGTVVTKYENVVCYYSGTEHKRMLGTLRKPSAGTAGVGWQVALQRAIARDYNVKHMISIPIYDGAQAGPCYGRLVGIIHGAILREIENSEEDRDSIGEKIAERVRRHNDKLAASFRAADMARIARADVTQRERDLDADAGGLSPALRHFLHVLPMAQDWKRVRIEQRRKDGSWKPFQYWGRTGRDWVKVNAHSPVISGLLGAKSERFMESDLSLLDMIEGVAPRLEESERRALDAWRLSFEYPDYALLPEDKEVLERQYWHEQIDIWSIVLPKVLLQRENVRREREALRQAVSAIMGRNMSHNIGSHVLARYRAAVKDKGDRTFAPEKGPLSSFLTYLQQRMDFLADVATSDRAFRFQTLSLQEQINQLNYDKLSELLGSDGEATIEPILLRFITGKERLTATVNYKSEADVQFACPGGEIGVHALFIILENIIRNSARHGGGSGAQVELTVSVGEADDKDLLKLTIVDPHSPATVRKRSSEGEATKTRVDDDINGIIRSPLLDTNGEAKPEYWGVREMQICAHYLRGFSLYDLEKKAKPPVLAAGRTTKTDALKYTIFLSRARRMVAVVKDKSKLWPENEVLQRWGIYVIKVKECEKPDWGAIGVKAGSYEFLIVENEVEGLPESPRERAEMGMPVRTLALSPCDTEKLRRKIDELIRQEGSASSSWMESLHRHYAEVTRDNHDIWKCKPLYGVALANGQALEPKPTLAWPQPSCIPGDGGLIETCKPLPDEAKRWLKGLSSKGIAAAWIDHAEKADFCDSWISVETARAGDAHARFLSQRLRDTTPSGGWEILAAAIPRVAVLDERIQSARDQTSRVRGYRLSDIWRFMGVWVPPKQDDNGGSCDLDSPSFSKCRDVLKKPTELCEQFPIDILVVHLTILERLNRERNEKTLAKTLDCLVGDSQAADAEIVIVTGRGVPAVARAAGGQGTDLRRVRYLPISALLESLNSRPSKLALMQTLWSAGRPSSAIS